MSKSIRTRFAPSPTGFLHIGGLRTALFCNAWAKKNKGIFILRIEDTDQKRYVTGAIKQIIESLKWAGLTPDEGVIDENQDNIIQKGEHGPYVQSHRLDLYKQFAQQLLEKGMAYKCYCSPERLDQMRVVQSAAKQMPKYDRHCLNLSAEEKAIKEKEGASHVVRFKVSDGETIEWDDIVFNKMSFGREQVDDFVMIKADGYATYNFANVIDDHLMDITHVMRGQEFLSSTPKHILLYTALKWDIPLFCHLPWILGKNKQKLSKRNADVSVDDYINKGVLPDALNNYLELLGWSPKNDQEIFSREEFIQKFDLKDIQKAGAVFDMEKLMWINGQYIRKLQPKELLELALPYLIKSNLIENDCDKYTNKITNKDVSEDQLILMLITEQPRLKLLQELPEKIEFYFIEQLEYDRELLTWKKGDPKELPEILNLIKDNLSQLQNWDKNSIEKNLKTLVEISGRGVGELFWPLRVALTGLQASPGPHEVAEVLGKYETIRRIDLALEKLL